MGYFRYVENVSANAETYFQAPYSNNLVTDILSLDDNKTSLFGYGYNTSFPYNLSMPSSLQIPDFNPITPAATTSPSLNQGDSSVESFEKIDDSNSELKPGLFKGRLAGQEATVTRICRKYNVSPQLVASIIGLESSWGTSNLAMHNNFMGYRAAGDLGRNEKGFGYFSTIEKGLEAAIKNLSRYTRFSDVKKVDFDNIDAIGRHYCEGGVWPGLVRKMYNSTVKRYSA